MISLTRNIQIDGNVMYRVLLSYEALSSLPSNCSMLDMTRRTCSSLKGLPTTWTDRGIPSAPSQQDLIIL